MPCFKIKCQATSKKVLVTGSSVATVVESAVRKCGLDEDGGYKVRAGNETSYSLYDV